MEKYYFIGFDDTITIRPCLLSLIALLTLFWTRNTKMDAGNGGKIDTASPG
jgi:hypothetical protein